MLHCIHVVAEDEAVYTFQKSKVTRADVVQWLSEAVNGDLLAAEFVLATLLCHIPKTSPESFHLNLKGMNEAQTAALCKKLQLLSTRCVVLGLDHATLAAVHVAPRSTDEKVWPGLLQMADDSCFLVNETVLLEGELKDVAAQNMLLLDRFLGMTRNVWLNRCQNSAMAH